MGHLVVIAVSQGKAGHGEKGDAFLVKNRNKGTFIYCNDT